MTPIARRIIARLHPSRYTRDGDYRTTQQQLVERGIGGFCIMDGTLEEVAETIGSLRTQATYPLLFAIDAETGLRMRIEDAAEFPHAFALGLQDPSVTEIVAAAIARSLRSVGIQWNFAPVADVASNPANPIIGIRAFSSQAPIVVEHVQAWIRAHQREGVASCVKHFPGHGDSLVDSHVALPIITANREELLARELVPFYAAIKAGVASIMVGHLAVPALDPSGGIASLSPAIIRSLLRDRLGYDGVIVTDALDMQPIRDRYSHGEAVVAAFAAGADVALLPSEPLEAITAAEDALQQGKLSETEHLEACRKIEHLAMIFAGQPPVMVSQSELAHVALDAAAGAIRIAGDRTVLPLSQYAHIAAFAIVREDAPLEAPTEFFRYLAELYRGNMDVGFITRTIDAEDIAAYTQAIGDAECIIIAVFERPRAYSTATSASDQFIQFLDRLSNGKPRILVVAGTPQTDITVDADVVLWTFSDTSPSCAAAALALTNRTAEMLDTPSTEEGMP